LVGEIRDNGQVMAADDDVSSTDRPGAATKPGRARIALFAVVAAAALALDVGSKALVVASLETSDSTHYHAPVRLLGGAIYLDEARNSGAAFSLGTGFTVILTVIALAVVAVILRTARRMRSTGWAVALGLVLGGALGNLVDRIFRAPGFGRGHVVDWISLFGPDGAHWPIFNLADSAIVCGAVLAGVLSVLGIDLDAKARARG
jgi:signal peptidase II